MRSNLTSFTPFPKLVRHLLWSENLALTESDIRSMQQQKSGTVQRTLSFYFTTRSSNCPSQWKHLSGTTDCLNPTHSKWIFWNWCLFDSCGGLFPTVRHVGKQGITAKNCNLIVYHVLWSGTKFLIAFDHLVDSLQEVFLSHSFPTGSNCIHACLCAHTANIGTCTFNIHFLRVFGGQLSRHMLLSSQKSLRIVRGYTSAHDQGGNLMPNPCNWRRWLQIQAKNKLCRLAQKSVRQIPEWWLRLSQFFWLR
jgi:hypothetical protein